MTLQLVICVIATVLLVGSVSCTIYGMDRYDKDDGGYIIWGFVMMLGVIVALFFLFFGSNGMLDDILGNTTKFPSANITSTPVQK